MPVSATSSGPKCQISVGGEAVIVPERPRRCSCARRVRPRGAGAHRPIWLYRARCRSARAPRPPRATAGRACAGCWSTWRCTVCSLTTSRSASCRLVSPSASRRQHLALARRQLRAAAAERPAPEPALSASVAARARSRAAAASRPIALERRARGRSRVCGGLIRRGREPVDGVLEQRPHAHRAPARPPPGPRSPFNGPVPASSASSRRLAHTNPRPSRSTNIKWVCSLGVMLRAGCRSVEGTERGRGGAGRVSWRSVALGEVGGRCGRRPRSSASSAWQRCGGRAGAVEQRQRLGGAALAAAQLGQAGERAGRPGRAGVGEVLDRGLQQRLGLRPAAAPAVDRRRTRRGRTRASSGCRSGRRTRRSGRSRRTRARSRRPTGRRRRGSSTPMRRRSGSARGRRARSPWPRRAGASLRRPRAPATSDAPSSASPSISRSGTPKRAADVSGLSARARVPLAASPARCWT